MAVILPNPHWIKLSLRSNVITQKQFARNQTGNCKSQVWYILLASKISASSLHTACFKDSKSFHFTRPAWYFESNCISFLNVSGFGNENIAQFNQDFFLCRDSIKANSDFKHKHIYAVMLTLTSISVAVKRSSQQMMDGHLPYGQQNAQSEMLASLANCVKGIGI